MVALRDRPLFTTEFDAASPLRPIAGAVYIFGLSTEDRSQHVDQLKLTSPDVRFVEISESAESQFRTIGSEQIVDSRKRRQISDWVRALSEPVVYLDITGLSHNIWAPLVKLLVEEKRCFRIVYVEPSEYRHNPTPRQGDIFDLSERITGIRPIPLFASLDDRPSDNVCFVALLGFEGTRLSHMLEQVQPPIDKVYPLIGAPGFRPEYPFFTYLGNSNPLVNSGASRNVRYAQSNCPFAAYYAIADIAARFPDDLIKIGLVGTKPHAIAAILHAIRSPDSVELVYDQAIRKKKRTEGVAKCLVYDISEFLPHCGLG